jgi:hypothetical protein
VPDEAEIRAITNRFETEPRGMRLVKDQINLSMARLIAIMAYRIIAVTKIMTAHVIG